MIMMISKKSTAMLCMVLLSGVKSASDKKSKFQLDDKVHIVADGIGCCGTIKKVIDGGAFYKVEFENSDGNLYCKYFKPDNITAAAAVALDDTDPTIDLPCAKPVKVARRTNRLNRSTASKDPPKFKMNDRVGWKSGYSHGEVTRVIESGMTYRYLVDWKKNPEDLESYCCCEDLEPARFEKGDDVVGRYKNNSDSQGDDKKYEYFDGELIKINRNPNHPVTYWVRNQTNVFEGGRWMFKYELKQFLMKDLGLVSRDEKTDVKSETRTFKIDDLVTGIILGDLDAEPKVFVGKVVEEKDGSFGCHEYIVENRHGKRQWFYADELMHV